MIFRLNKVNQDYWVIFEVMILLIPKLRHIAERREVSDFGIPERQELDLRREPRLVEGANEIGRKHEAAFEYRDD